MEARPDCTCDDCKKAAVKRWVETQCRIHGCRMDVESHVEGPLYRERHFCFRGKGSKVQ